MSNDFRATITEVPPLVLREPLAATLGAFNGDDHNVAFSFDDVVKAAGHVCPTVTGTYLAVSRALDALYGDEVPLRGGIAVTIAGSREEGALGGMAQVITHVTGAAGAGGFKGLSGRFARRGLLRFEGESDGAAVITFERVDTGAAVTVRFSPWLVPFPVEKGSRAVALMEKVVGGDATADEAREFADLWMEKIAVMLRGEDIEEWLVLEEA